MKMIIVVALALVAVAVAAPPATPLETAKIISSEFEKQPEGNYLFKFQADNSITRQEEGVLKELVDENNKPVKVIIVRGSYGYTGPDGQPEQINYYADESGYHAEGKSIPKAPGASRR